MGIKDIHRDYLKSKNRMALRESCEFGAWYRPTDITLPRDENLTVLTGYGWIPYTITGFDQVNWN